MGDQAYLQFFRGMSEGAAEALYTNLYSPAAKQMLVHHVLSNGNAPAGAPGFRDRFMSALRANGEPDSFGYPIHLRRVAIADGRLDGQGDPGGTPCGKMFDMDVRFRTGHAILVSVGSAISQFLTFSSQSAPIRIAACTVRYAPAPGTSCTVFEGLLNYSYFGYNLAPLGGFYNIPQYGRRVVDAGSQGSWDLAPGGIRNTQASLKEQAEAGGSYSAGQGRAKAYKIEVTNVHENHCFIPTISALGFQYQSTASYQNTSNLPNPYTNLLSRGNLLCNDEVPFDDFYAPDADNLGHVTTNAGAVAFLVRELTPRVATPVFAANPEGVCPDGGQADYGVVYCAPRAGQPGTTYTWAVVGGGIQITGGQGTPIVTVQSVPGYTGTARLQVVATRAGYVASAPALANVPVENGYVSLNGPAGPLCYSEDFTYTFRRFLAPGPVTWHVFLDGVPHDDFIVSSSNTGLLAWPGSAGTMRVTASATNQCGGQPLTASATTTVVEVFRGQYAYEPCPARQGRPAPKRPAQPAAYPNPADGYLTLAAPEAAAGPGPRTAVLYNAQGREVRRARQPQGAQLPTADLPSGLYYLLVEHGGQVMRSQIRVQH